MNIQPQKYYKISEEFQKEFRLSHQFVFVDSIYNDVFVRIELPEGKTLLPKSILKEISSENIMKIYTYSHNMLEYIDKNNLQIPEIKYEELVFIGEIHKDEDGYEQYQFFDKCSILHIWKNPKKDGKYDSEIDIFGKHFFNTYTEALEFVEFCIQQTISQHQGYIKNLNKMMSDLSEEIYYPDNFEYDAEKQLQIIQFILNYGPYTQDNIYDIIKLADDKHRSKYGRYLNGVVTIDNIVNILYNEMQNNKITYDTEGFCYLKHKPLHNFDLISETEKEALTGSWFKSL